MRNETVEKEKSGNAETSGTSNKKVKNAKRKAKNEKQKKKKIIK